MTDQSGIYVIYNIKDGKYYIGSTIRLKRREFEHFNELRKNIHKNRYLQFAYNKYGKDNFRYRVIEYWDKDDLIAREQLYLDMFKPPYNMTPTAYSYLGYKHTDESRKKMSDAQKGKKHSEEQNQKMREIMLNGNYDLGQRAIYQIDKDTFKIIHEYKSISEAARAIGRKPAAISHVCGTFKVPSFGNVDRYRKTCSGYIWQYVNRTPNEIEADRERHKKQIYYNNPLFQIDNITEEIIYRYRSIQEAERITGINDLNIDMGCTNPDYIICGYKWRYCE